MGRTTKSDGFSFASALAFRYLCDAKAEDGAFGHGLCRDIEDSYPAWKQAGIDIHIVRSLNVLK